jgi:hypothetical protein
VILTQHANHSYAFAAQRDWQATALALLSLVIVRDSRLGQIVSGILLALAFGLRPQVVVLLPAVLWALPQRRLWLIAWGLGVLVQFLPLVLYGIFDDLINSLRNIRNSGIYATPRDRLGDITQDLASWRSVVLGLMVVAWVVQWRSDRTIRSPQSRLLLVWLVAIAGVWLYKPMSPYPHKYLEQPLILALSVATVPIIATVYRLLPLRGQSLGCTVVVLMVLALLAEPKARFCQPKEIRWLWRQVRGLPPNSLSPSGYVGEPYMTIAAVYPWDDYRRTIAYLKALPPGVQVANLMAGPVAINGDSGRRTPLPAESIMWILVVGRRDDAKFLRAIRETRDTVVVWQPLESSLTEVLAQFEPILREHYQLQAKFGLVEVWGRKSRD